MQNQTNNSTASPTGNGWQPCVVILILVAAAALVGAQYGPSDWYRTLAKPPWTPPNFVFPIAWTLLYLMIAASGCLLFRRSGWRSPAMQWWLGQLSLNALWSWLFFGRHHIGWALADVVLLLGAIAATISLAWTRQRMAAWLLVPYLAWVGFATALNAAIWRLNR